MDPKGRLLSETGGVICHMCPCVGSACPEILLDEANQSLCLKSQGWSRGKLWRCPSCTIEKCSGPQLARPDLLRCRHGRPAGPWLQEGFGPGVPDDQVPPPPPVQPQGFGREVPLPPPPPPPPPPLPHPWPPSSPERFGQHGRCEADDCRGCLAVCAACTRWLMQPLISSDFTNELRTLTCAMNMLPTVCTPAFLITQDEQQMRLMARQLPQGQDHGNLAGSCLMLVMLRPHLYMTNPVPLRLLGYPAPAALLSVDCNPHSGSGPDNKRTNLLEALCAYWLQQQEGQRIFTHVQHLWHLMRMRVDFALRDCSLPHPVCAHIALRRAL